MKVLLWTRCTDSTVRSKQSILLEKKFDLRFVKCIIVKQSKLRDKYNPFLTVHKTYVGVVCSVAVRRHSTPIDRYHVCVPFLGRTGITVFLIFLKLMLEYSLTVRSHNSGGSWKYRSFVISKLPFTEANRYSGQMAELFTEVYSFLPLAHCVNNKILVSYFAEYVLM